MGKNAWRIYRILLYSIVILGLVIYSSTNYHFILDDEKNAPDYLNKNDSSINRLQNIINRFNLDKSKLNDSKMSLDSIVFGNAMQNGGWSNLIGILKTPKQQLLLLPWITLRNIEPLSSMDDYRILVKANRTYISKVSKEKNSENYSPFKKVDFYVNPNKYLNKYNSNGYDDLEIYVPIKNKPVFYLLTTVNSLWFVITILSCLFLLGNSWQFLFAISNGKAFEWKNVKRLKSCVWLIFGLLLFQYIVMIILYLGFYKILYEDVQVKSWMDVINWKLWIMLLIYFSLFLAFARGYKLQSEQEYTI